MARAMRVLVADHDVDTVERTALLLQLDGHQVETANAPNARYVKSGAASPDCRLRLICSNRPYSAAPDVLCSSADQPSRLPPSCCRL